MNEQSTPETDALVGRLSMSPEVSIRCFPKALSELAKKLERERDEAIAALIVIDERYIDGCDTYEDWKFMGDTARAFLLENTKDHPNQQDET